MAHLFEPLRLRDVEFSNRIFVSPMCQYSCQDGFATGWHLVHLGSRAVGRAAMVMALTSQHSVRATSWFWAVILASQVKGRADSVVWD